MYSFFSTTFSAVQLYKHSESWYMTWIDEKTWSSNPYCFLLQHSYGVILFFFYIPELSGGPLSDEYTLIQFHAHWGSDDSKGAEHTINGRQYSAEVKAFCFKSWIPTLRSWVQIPPVRTFFSFHQSKIISKVLFILQFFISILDFFFVCVVCLNLIE